eukprot:comp14528_c0_seq1/m.10737 comp14528_c0_seq1/g.10737  ORF comp14528_c0_seq1/g.10737 comp14528_c0_seq1/m.10737 type:complete len:1107 (-) comp14528_c0_seq1:147-3467(-)
MPSVTPAHLHSLQANPANIRNICVLAHVDHGKTTLTDSLIAANAIISERLAGKVRYLDSRPDEQQRGITMKSSVISLLHHYGEQPYLVNLIDSPGHVDFASEVSTAVRLCDGALVVVDVGEGVGPQTYSVLRQAYHENIKPVLVLNKMDRLITELKFSPQEAIVHLQKILEQVNAAVATLFTADYMEKAALDEEKYEGLDYADDSNLYFEPERGNVVFASAVDGWAFGIEHFADMVASKLGCSAGVLRRTLWGDFWFNPKTKRIMKGAIEKGKKSLFVQFVLETIWEVYNSVLSADKEKVDKITKALHLKILPRDIKSGPRPHLQAVMRQWMPLAKAVLDMVALRLPSPKEIPSERVSKLLYGPKAPWSYPEDTQALFPAVCSCDNTPKEEGGPEMLAFVAKMESFDWDSLPSNRARVLTAEELRERSQAARERLRQQQQHGANQAVGPTGQPLDPEAPQPPTEGENGAHQAVAQKEEGKDDEKEELTAEEKEALSLVGFARVYSGCLKVGQTVHVLGPKYSPTDRNSSHHQVITISHLYIVMGKDLEPIDSIGAGNIVGIGGLAGCVLKSATLCTTDAAPALLSLHMEAAPIVRVALEPERVQDLPKLVAGLRMLNQADSLVEITHTEKGEHIIHTAGEVHLERCLEDLQERYAKIRIKKSAPIVPFRETVVPTPKTDMMNESIANQTVMGKSLNPALARDEDSEDSELEPPKWIEIVPPAKFVKLRVRAVPLPKAVVRVLDDFNDLLKTMFEKHLFLGGDRAKNTVESDQTADLEILFREKLKEAFRPNDDEEWDEDWLEDTVDRIWAFGPRRMGTNMLLNCIPAYNRASAIPNPKAHGREKAGTPTTDTSAQVVRRNQRLADLDNSIVNGFQLATSAGPLCEEPMRGVCFRVEDAVFAEDLMEHPEAPPTPTMDRALDSGVESGAEGEVPQNVSLRTGSMSGQLVSAVKEGCRRAVLLANPRLAVAMYTCEIQATSDVLGKVYAVVSKRQGIIISEEMREGTDVFIIKCYLPVATSFGFVDELRKRASGSASPQLVFSHWETEPMDPFWVPFTEEEVMHYGEKADSENTARKYMNDVRKRKGLKVQEKLVEHAEKQRTLSRNK